MSAPAFLSKFSNFFLFYPPLFIQYSTEECSTVQLLVYILYLFVARGHCTSVYILIQLLLTLLILVLSYIVFVDIVCNGL